MGTEKVRLQIKNQLYLWIFCALIGGTAGAVVWVFLKVMAEGMAFIWEWIPNQIPLPYYTLIVCTAGGLLIGVFRKRYGDYPEELETVLGKVKKEKHYEYKNMLVMLLAALFPLLIGSSIGPEAGLTGVIVGLCYWAGNNVKFAGEHAKEYSKIGMAVSLSVLFHSPLFGIFEVEEETDGEVQQWNKSSRIILYGLALAAGTGIYAGLSALFGAGLSGFPAFDSVKLQWQDYPMMAVYILCGVILAYFYEIVNKNSNAVAERIPGVIREMTAGICMGIAGMLVPAVMFSGEEQMGELMYSYTEYLPIALIGIAFFKIFLTNICIQFGLKGGHFFPMIFAGVAMGYGVSLLVFPGDGLHVVFAAAIVTASLLGGIMKKPLAVTMLLFLCFPIKTFVWILLAAAVGSRCVK